MVMYALRFKCILVNINLFELVLKGNSNYVSNREKIFLVGYWFLGR